MAWIPSIDQFVSETTVAPFIASGSSILEEHHILIIVPTTDKDLTAIRTGNNDYSSLSGGNWSDHSSGYSFYSMPLTDANLSYSFTNPAGLAILGYGFGNYESYYYLAGSALRKLDAFFYVDDIHYQDLEEHMLCADSVNVEAFVQYKMHQEQGHLRWFIDDVEDISIKDNLKWKKKLSEGLHKISMIVKNEYGATDTLHTVLIIDLFDIEITGSSVCLSGTTTLTVANVLDGFVYSWFSDDSYTDMIVQATSLETTTLNDNTVFYIEAKSNKNCTIRDSIKIAFVTRPEVVAMDDLHICYGDEVKLETLQSDGDVTWNVNTTTIYPFTTQQYFVTASRPPCPDATDSVTITVGDSLYIGPSELTKYEPEVDYLQQLTSNAESPIFTVINSSLPSGLNLSTAGEISGVNINSENSESVSFFTVQVEDAFGCKTRKEFALKKTMLAPHIFSPNADGINDFFMKGYKVVIFDRLGIPLFTGDDGWDGTYNGKPVSQDIYFYKLEYRDENEKTLIKTGYVGVIYGFLNF
jgi:gliding motility-associated-like protein